MPVSDLADRTQRLNIAEAEVSSYYNNYLSLTNVLTYFETYHRKTIIVECCDFKLGCADDVLNVLLNVVSDSRVASFKPKYCRPNVIFTVTFISFHYLQSVI